jgi:glycosyltransferase involved in cell wall biosynthesis
MTRVLYGLWNYPQISETYVEAEIQYALSQGIEVRVWSSVSLKPDLVPGVPVYRGSLKDAVRDFSPHVFHTHFLQAAPGFLGETGSVPVTIRGHSFDWSPAAAESVLQDNRVKKVWLFPHFAAQLPPHPKVAGLTVAYSSKLYGPHERKDRRLVLRAAAGRPNKGLADFFTAAALCPEFRFVLCVAEAGGPGGGKEFIQKLHDEAQASRGRVIFHPDVRQPQIGDLTRLAGIYLFTSDPQSHPFGMPVSMAESLATGSYVLARNRPGAPAFLGDAGRLYNSPEEAAEAVNATLAWNEAAWGEAWNRAVARGESFKDVNVMGPVVDFWKSLS